jgi:hypothetical protein
MIYEYVSSTYLNGLVNYVTPVKIVLLERYDLIEKDSFAKQLEEAKQAPYTKLGIFGDDILVLAHDEEVPGWLFFWFDCDVSDCCVGNFGAGLTQTEAEEEFMRFVAGLVHDNAEVMKAVIRKEKEDHPNYGTECITGYVELPLDIWKGWVKF